MSKDERPEHAVVQGGRDGASPLLNEDETAAFHKGVAEFNAGYYFECHDTLEDMWTGIRGPSRDFFQGLIQVSVAFYHLSGGNLPGAESMVRRALKRFAGYPDRYFGFDLAAHREELQGWLDRIVAAQVDGLILADLPKWSFGPP
jgi:predicted metal-dependent hydrolase